MEGPAPRSVWTDVDQPTHPENAIPPHGTISRRQGKPEYEKGGQRGENNMGEDRERRNMRQLRVRMLQLREVQGSPLVRAGNAKGIRKILVRRIASRRRLPHQSEGESTQT